MDYFQKKENNYLKNKMKDTLDLLQKHTAYFGGSDYHMSHAARPWNITIVLSQPRCGSTLLLRLLNIACLTRTTGDRDPLFYKACIDSYKTFRNEAIYENIGEMEKIGKFPDRYQGSHEAADRYNFSFSMRGLLFSGPYSSAIKTTSIGFGNSMTEDLIELCKYITDQRSDEFNFTIMFLTRNHDDIIKSAKKVGACPDEDIYRKYLSEQLEQFKECRDLNNPWVKYEDLVEDPMKILRKIPTIYIPNKSAVDRIMKNKISV